MVDTRGIIIVLLVLAVAGLGFALYQERQRTIEIKLPSVKIDGR